MTFIPYRGSSSISTSTRSGVPTWTKVTMGVVVANGLLALGGWWFRDLFTLLPPAAVAGLLIGWIRRAVLVRNALGESFVSALFGAGWGKNNGLLLLLDLASRTLMGYGVGVAFAAFGAIHPPSIIHCTSIAMVADPEGRGQISVHGSSSSPCYSCWLQSWDC